MKNFSNIQPNLNLFCTNYGVFQVYCLYITNLSTIQFNMKKTIHTNNSNSQVSNKHVDITVKNNITPPMSISTTRKFLAFFNLKLVCQRTNASKRQKE